MPEEVVFREMSLEDQVQWWMDKYFALMDQHANLINDLHAIRRILEGRDASH